MTSRCGYIAIIGRPNVGKSTLLNALLQKKLSITSRKPQTTRHQILGIKSTAHAQFIFVDTPGIHAADKKKLNQYLNRAALCALRKVDIILWVIEAAGLQAGDGLILKKLNAVVKKPVLLGINKIDLLKNSAMMLELIDNISKKADFSEIIPISAQKKENISKLEKLIERYLPENEFFFDKTALTDRPDAFMAAEMIREQVVRSLGQELPYAAMVKIETIKPMPHILTISAVIFVEKEGQKKIIIGRQGAVLKLIGQKARLEMENYFGRKIFLQLWVKVKAGWSENDSILRNSLQ